MSMNLNMKNSCPICSCILLRHIYQKNLIWFCLQCRQEMPNFSSKDIVDLSTQSLPKKVEKRVENYSRTIDFQGQTQHNLLLVDKSLSWLESLIEEGKIRLDIANFIITKSQSIINNALVTAANLSSEYLEHNREKPFELKKFSCLRDAEIILLYICYAILQQNSDLLKNQYFRDLKETYAALNIPVCQKVRVINLMKDSVMSFVNHRTFNLLEYTTEHNCSYWNLEIASYFDTVVECIT